PSSITTPRFPTGSPVSAKRSARQPHTPSTGRTRSASTHASAPSAQRPSRSTRMAQPVFRQRGRDKPRPPRAQRLRHPERSEGPYAKRSDVPRFSPRCRAPRSLRPPLRRTRIGGTFRDRPRPATHASASPSPVVHPRGTNCISRIGHSASFWSPEFPSFKNLPKARKADRTPRVGLSNLPRQTRETAPVTVTGAARPGSEEDNYRLRTACNDAPPASKAAAPTNARAIAVPLPPPDSPAPVEGSPFTGAVGCAPGAAVGTGVGVCPERSSGTK